MSWAWILGSFAVVAWLPASAMAGILTVGPGKAYQTVKDAVAAAKPGDTIEVDAGDYVDDISSIKVNDLTIRGVGGRPHLKATVPPPNKKGIFVVEAGVGPVTIENLEFSGSKISEGDGNNGAGIRAQGTDLRVKSCYIHDNQNGILAGDGLMTVENSEFAYNGQAGYEHNIYVGTSPKFVFRGNYSHHAKSGHAVKSRALENHIEYNRLMEEADGNGSALIDLPQGGLTYIIGNLIQKGPAAENKYRVVLYKGEGATNPDLRLYVSHNTFVNDGPPAVVFIDVPVATDVTLTNNLFVGMGTTLKTGAMMPIITETGTLQTEMGGLVDRAGYDYHLLPDAPGIDMGAPADMLLTPTSQYVHPQMFEPRPVVDAPDIGAYEFGEAPVDTTGGDTDSSSGGGDSTGGQATTTTLGNTDDTGAQTDDTGAQTVGTGGTGGQSGGPTTSGDAPTSDGVGTTGGATTGGASGTGTDTSDEAGDSGCSCTSDRQGGAGWALLGLALLGLRRRATRQR